MLETKEQKQIFAGSIILIMVLGLVSFWHRPDLTVKDQTPTSSNDVAEARAYLNYLNNLPVDKEASKKLFQTLLTDKDVEQQVKTALGADQKPVMPQINEKDFKLSKDSGKAAVESYLSATVGSTLSFNTQASTANQGLFNQDSQSFAQAKKAFDDLTAKLAQTGVPEEAKALHKALLTAMAGYGKLLDVSQKYDNSSESDQPQVWPEVYQDYAIVNQGAQDYAAQLTSITGKYKITQISVPNTLAAQDPKGSDGTLPFIKTAHAFLGVGDQTFTITIGNIPAIIMDAVKEGLRSAFLKFMGSMIQNLISKIEQNYMIANFLYYSDALVAGQYTDDYLKKYVSQQVDRDIIKKFIPQLSCGSNTASLRPVFEAKAKDYLGFDPKTVKPSDPNYYTKLAKVGDLLSSPTGWQLHFQDLAAQAESQAQKAADRELSSPGLKAPRDVLQNGIGKTVNSLISAQRASFGALLDLGISNADSIISKIVGQLTQTLLNNFVFQGVTGAPGGSVGVLKEQATCVAVAQLKPVLALPTSAYQDPSAPPTQDQLIQEACAKNPRGCVQPPAPATKP